MINMQNEIKIDLDSSSYATKSEFDQNRSKFTKKMIYLT